MSASPVLRFQTCAPAPIFRAGADDPNSRPHACIADTFMDSPSAHSTHQEFYMQSQPHSFNESLSLYIIFISPIQGEIVSSVDDVCESCCKPSWVSWAEQFSENMEFGCLQTGPLVHQSHDFTDHVTLYCSFNFRFHLWILSSSLA